MLRLRQLALVAHDLSAAEAQISEALGVPLVFRDPGVGTFGLHNGLFLIGDQFLEIVSPTEAGTTAGRLLDKRGGDGGYMVLVQTNDLAPFRDRTEQHDVRIVYEARGEGIRGLHLHPADIGSAILSVDRSDDPADWAWGGPQWQSYHGDLDAPVARIVAATLSAHDSTATLARWATVLGRPVTPRDNDPAGGVIELDDAEIRVGPADERGPGLVAIDMLVTDRARAGTTVELVGVTINFV